MYFLGYRKGAFVKIYAHDKGKYVKGVVTQLIGVSVTRSKYAFDIDVQLFEPVQGNDARFFSRGTYEPLQMKLI
jgi:hypothetical protein